MNQEKIGQFIAKKRKEKGLKQSDLSMKLGVTDRSVSNWERGKNMPDLSLFQPICKILDVSINELLNGEEIEQKDADKYEETIINTINYSNDKIKKIIKKLCVSAIVLGILFILCSLTLFSWNDAVGNLYSVLGIVVGLIGTIKLTQNLKLINKLVYSLGIFFIILLLTVLIDIINIKYNDAKPRFILNVIDDNNGTLYDTPLYDVYDCDNKNHNIVKFNNALAIDNIKEICSE